MDKGLPDFPRVFFVHREADARPVAGSAKFFQLVQDDAAVFFPPLPNFFNEFFPSQIKAADVLLAQFFFHDVLGGDAGVIGSRQPGGLKALHPAVTDKNIFNRRVESVAHVKRAGDVGGRQEDGKSAGFRFAASGEIVRIEIAALFPESIDFFFRCFRVVSAADFFSIHCIDWR